MNKNILWGSVVVVIVVLIAWSLYSNGTNTDLITKDTEIKTESIDVTPNKNVVSTKPTTTVKSETFTNILPKLGNYQCDYEEVTASYRSTNTIYLSDGKMRAEFRSMASSGVGTGSIMVYDGTNLYTWTEGKTAGTVTQPKSLSDFPTLIPKDLVTSKSLGSGLNSVSWSCHAWSKDASLFVKPAYLKV